MINFYRMCDVLIGRCVVRLAIVQASGDFLPTMPIVP